MADNLLTDKEHKALAVEIVKALNALRHSYTTAEIKSHCSICGQTESHSNHIGIWKLTDKGVWYSVDGPEDQAFSLHFEGYGNQGKLRIDGTFPRAQGGNCISLPYGTVEPEIKVSLSRGAETIAKDITRRFMPKYLLILAKVQAIKKERDSYEAKRTENTIGLMKAFNVTFNDPRLKALLDDAINNGHFYIGAHRCFHGEVRVSDITASINIDSVPVATVHKIAALLMALKKEQH